MTHQEPLELMGAPGSPYTRKMLSLLRYRRIPHAMLWGGMLSPKPGYPEPKVKLLPTFYFRTADGGREAAVDSTPIARRLERDYEGRSAIPDDPVLSFLNYLIEDYADEWLTKAMFHYRWAHAADAAHAAPLLIFWSLPDTPPEQARARADMIGKRQIDRLYVVGSNATTATTIEASYARLLAILDPLIQRQGYVLGSKPSTADFALFGQLTQLVWVEPTPADVQRKMAPRVRAWVDRMDDLSGHDGGAWLTRTGAADALRPLLTEIGRVYALFLIANARAAAAGEAEMHCEIDGRAWTQPTFAYQAKCLQWLRGEFAALSADDQRDVRALLDETGCEVLLA